MTPEPCPKNCDGTMRLLGTGQRPGITTTFHECDACGHYERRVSTGHAEPSLLDEDTP